MDDIVKFKQPPLENQLKQLYRKGRKKAGEQGGHKGMRPKRIMGYFCVSGHDKGKQCAQGKKHDAVQKDLLHHRSTMGGYAPAVGPEQRQLIGEFGALGAREHGGSKDQEQVKSQEIGCKDTFSVPVPFGRQLPQAEEQKCRCQEYRQVDRQGPFGAV